MKRIRLPIFFLLLGVLIGYSPVALLAQAPTITPKGVKPGVIQAISLNRAGTYCHLHFPAIDPKTLAGNNPKLLPPDTGDIIDFYGPCDHDPLGYDGVLAFYKMKDDKICSVRVHCTLNEYNPQVFTGCS